MQNNDISWNKKKYFLFANVLLAALLFVTIVNYILAFTAVVLFYVFYTRPDDCTEHKVFISLNLIFCIIVSVVSVLPKVQVMLRCQRTPASMGQRAMSALQTHKDAYLLNAQYSRQADQH